MRLSLLCLACAGIAVLTSAAVAQDTDKDPKVKLDAGGLLIKPPKPGAPEVKPAPLAWPRLDRGAPLCRTEADLERLAANRTGGAGGGPADCRVITAPTGIDIVQRKAPGRTLVQVSGQPTNAGWTDVWLPEKAPGGAGAKPAALR